MASRAAPRRGRRPRLAGFAETAQHLTDLTQVPKTARTLVPTRLLSMLALFKISHFTVTERKSVPLNSYQMLSESS